MRSCFKPNKSHHGDTRDNQEHRRGHLQARRRLDATRAGEQEGAGFEQRLGNDPVVDLSRREVSPALFVKLFREPLGGHANLFDSPAAIRGLDDQGLDVSTFGRVKLGPAQKRSAGDRCGQCS